MVYIETVERMSEAQIIDRFRRHLGYGPGEVDNMWASNGTTHMCTRGTLPNGDQVLDGPTWRSDLTHHCEGDCTIHPDDNACQQDRWTNCRCPSPHCVGDGVEHELADPQPVTVYVLDLR